MMQTTDLFSIVVSINHLSDAVQQLQDVAKEAGKVDWLKDYLMPIGTLLISAVVAYFSAISGYEWQDRFQVNKLKVDTVNKTIMTFQNMQGTLLSLKANYAWSLPGDPLQRACAMPQLIYSYNPVALNYEHLVQVIMSTDENLHQNPWLHIASYISMQDQFNQLNKIIDKRNVIDFQVKDDLAKKYSRKSYSLQEVLEGVDPISLQKYVELTEIIINMVDNMIVSTNDFLNNFPQLAKEMMGNNLSKHYKMINAYKNISDAAKELQKRTTPLNITLTAQLLNISESDVQEKLCDQSYTIQTRDNSKC
ncbi:hypothetical protein LWU68_01635 [Enterobacter cloacae]|uniref:hypothetical protein n=1 Tax=Enterobacter cloacae TaxID=550 RepID=UPI001E5EF93A|nr:hypothetical protein [Enterobacter cloacae]MCE1395605.1 hypothetical protein [Enterobacter cloacae]